MAAERVYTREPLRRVDVLNVPALSEPLRWDSILGGWLIGLTFFAFLALLGVATGLTAVNSGTAAATGSTATATDAGRNSMIWTGVASIIAYLIGGYFASRIARVISRDNGALNGLMVFLISVPFMLLMGALSATGIVSGLGGLAGGIFSGGMQAVTSGVSPQQMGAQLTPQQITQATEAARNTAWAGLILGLICCAVSAIGGFFGAIPEDRMVQERVDAE